MQHQPNTTVYSEAGKRETGGEVDNSPRGATDVNCYKQLLLFLPHMQRALDFADDDAVAVFDLYVEDGLDFGLGFGGAAHFVNLLLGQAELSEHGSLGGFAVANRSGFVPDDVVGAEVFHE